MVYLSETFTVLLPSAAVSKFKSFNYVMNESKLDVPSLWDLVNDCLFI